MALHVGHNCVPWGDCDVCGAKVEPQYRQRTDVCAMCGAGFTVCRCRHQLREWRESMSVLDGPGEGTWSVFAQKVVEQRDKAIEERNDVFRRLRDAERSMFSMEAERDAARKERDEALRLLATRVEAKRLDEAQEEIERLRAACTLALRVMEQTNRVTVPPFAKFITLDFAPEDVAVLRAALEKKP